MRTGALSVHAAVAGVFFALGLGVGLWGGAAGAILTRAGVDPASFGVILTVYTGVYLMAMSAGGALAHRFGPPRVLTVSAGLFGATLCGLLDAGSGPTVAGFLLASGLFGGVVDVTMNAEGARIERLRGKPVLARLHASASAGIALGAILGSLLAASVAPWVAGLLALASLAGAGLAYDRAARREPAPPQAPAAPHAARGLSFTPALIGLGLVIGVSVAAETAATGWSSLLLRDEALRLAAIAGLGAGFFAICQATLRFNADIIRLQVSDGRIIVVSFAIATLGFTLAAADVGFAASVAGFALIGFGTGAIVPCSYALAARQSPGRPAVGLASASLISTLTRLPAPLATGAIAEHFSLPAAFGAFALALAAAGLGMFLFGPDRGEASFGGKE